MNKIILNILSSIEKRGYNAYLVGGYVRNYLLKKDSFDIDIATSMPFEELKKIFKDATIFNNYGSIKFKEDKFIISITSYRKELSYKNNKPNKIIYTSSLEEDAKRRDFTINSIYMDKNKQIIDPFNGTEDLTNKLIRVIGNVDDKLKEDSTRILRALRFMSDLNFELEDTLNKFIINHGNLIKNINYNKKKEELDKIFDNANCNIFLKYIKDNKLQEYFEIFFNEIKESNNYLECWSNLTYSLKYPFSNKEKKFINSFKNLKK